MSQIDWSKAPEGATHYGESGLSTYFYRIPSALGGSYDYWNIKSHDPKWVSGFNKTVAVVLLQRPEPWNGTGLPPVGTVCECRVRAGEDWVGCEVVAHHGHYAIAYVDENTVMLSSGIRFRPIRTPEQIAADEREAAIEEMYQIYKNSPGLATQQGMAALYDHGYRKQSTCDPTGCDD